MTSPARPTLGRTIVALAVLVAAIAALHLAGRLGLRGPDGLSQAELSAWLADPLTVAATMTRWLALMLAYYLLAVIVLVRLAGDRPTIAGVQIIPSHTAHLVGLLLGIGAVGAPLAQHVASSHALVSDAPASITDLRLEDVPTLADVPVLEERQALPDTSAVVNAAESARSPGNSSPADAAGIDEITVEAGEHLWSISEERLAEAWGRTDLRDEDIVPYWRTVIEANRDRLIDRDNPDLILPGQVLVLPEPPTDPGA